MSIFDQFLKEICEYREALQAPKRTLAPEVQAVIEAALTKKFGPMQPAKTILNAEEMKLVILTVLTQGSASGIEIIERLEKLQVELETYGSGLILGLLHQMVVQGVLETRFDGDKAVTGYGLTDRGKDFLRKEKATVLSIDGIAWNAI